MNDSLVIPLEDVSPHSPDAKRRKLESTSSLDKPMIEKPPKPFGKLTKHDLKKYKEMRLRAFDWRVGRAQLEVDQHPRKLTRSRTFPPNQLQGYEEQSADRLLSETNPAMVFKASPKSRAVDPQHLDGITTETGMTNALSVEDLPIKALTINSEKEDLRESIQTVLNKLTFHLPFLRSINLDSPRFKQLEIYELQELRSICKGLEAQLELGQSQKVEIQRRLNDLSRRLETASQPSQLAHDKVNINSRPMNDQTVNSPPTETHSRMEVIMSKLQQFIKEVDPKFQADPSLINIDQHQYSMILTELFEIIQRGKQSSTGLGKNPKYISIQEKESSLKESLGINDQEWNLIQETTFWIRSLIPTYTNSQNALNLKLSHLDLWYENLSKPIM
ncbi:hypothetical protein DFH28DRAFT_192845 [Melampsora americana]|nr:hypothetical protein DFH28DRAFT_192845 [Melampsora americana]